MNEGYSVLLYVYDLNCDEESKVIKLTYYNVLEVRSTEARSHSCMPTTTVKVESNKEKFVSISGIILI